MSIVEDDKWWLMRAMLTLTFAAGKLKAITPVIIECAQTLVRHLNDATERGELIELKK